MEYRVYCDGGTYKSNPSHLGYWGFTVWDELNLIYAQCGRVVGDVDSLYCELKAVERAYEFLTHNPLNKCVVFTDSMTCVNVVDRSNTLGGKKQLLGNMIRYQSLTLVGSMLNHVDREDDHQSFTDVVARLGLKESLVFDSQEDLNKLKRRF